MPYAPPETTVQPRSPSWWPSSAATCSPYAVDAREPTTATERSTSSSNPPGPPTPPPPPGPPSGGARGAPARGGGVGGGRVVRLFPPQTQGQRVQRQGRP